MTRRPPPVRAVVTVAGALALLVAGGCAGDEDGSGRDATPSTTAPTTAPDTLPVGALPAGLRDVEAGQCFLLPVDDVPAEDRAVWLVSCDLPHTHEVVAVVEYGGDTDDGAYPGTAVVQEWSEDACFERFEPFVGTAWTRSELDLEVWWPSEESWDLDDRDVICTVFPTDGRTVTGTLRGVGR